MHNYIMKNLIHNKLAILIKGLDENSYIIIRDSSNNTILFDRKLVMRDYEYIEVMLEKGKYYNIHVNNSKVSTAYVWSDENVLSDGVTFIEFAGQSIKSYNKYNMSEAYRENYRNQYHFSPFINWMNDPNGLIYFKGLYHIFYQAYPNENKWGLMHWGHAVSENLINWTHLPIALHPQKMLIGSNDLFGGAYSGSAVEKDSDIVLLFTRHFQSKTFNEIFSETQHKVVSKDGVNFEEEKEVISEIPNNNVGKAFRDPKVWLHDDGKWYMILGAIENEMPSVLLYSSHDLEYWNYEGVLYQETEINCITIECPDFFKLGDKYVLIAALLNSVDKKTNRKNLTYYYIGEFKDNKFVVEHRDVVDFGTDFYAMQTFNQGDRRIGMAWLDNWENTYMCQDQTSSGVMSLPRELQLMDNNLILRPVKEVELLRDKLLENNIRKCYDIKNIGDNTLELEVKFSSNTNFNIRFALDETEKNYLQLVFSNNRLQIRQVEENKDLDIEYIKNLEKLKNIHVYLDRSSIEVFANDYSVCGTKRYYLSNAKDRVKLEFENESNVLSFNLWKLKPIW